MMAFVILPPGDKFKILSPYEIVQLAQVITNDGNNLAEGFRNLEDKWKINDNVYDIDLVGLAAIPLSQTVNDDNNNNKEFVRTVQEQRNKRRKECKKDACKRKREINALKVKTKKRQKVNNKNEGEIDWGTQVFDLFVNDRNEGGGVCCSNVLNV